MYDPIVVELVEPGSCPCSIGDRSSFEAFELIFNPDTTEANFRPIARQSEG